MISKNIKLLITLLFLIVNLSSIAFAGKIITGTFNYMPGFAEMAEERFFYSDDYFSGEIDNEYFISMSLNLAYSTFEIENDTYVRSLFDQIGFEDIETEDMTIKPSISTIGTVMAHKKIGDKDLLAVSIRGNKYSAEWASNFIAGEDGNAKIENAVAIVLRGIVVLK